ncbi:hypothetical protein BGZ60DRAFT_136788 [Tricladium varicosporioides]|nr:hypothetical protein BGZ60DRAFT_136788 [Hymenoscyphus varicosporioides]
MQLTSVLTTFLLVASSIANPTLTYDSRGLCKAPKCTSFCPDGTPFDCCVTYIRDPCSDHQACKWEDCICNCKNGAGTYICNAQYFRDPCAPLPSAATA